MENILHILDNCESINKYYLIDPWRNLDNWNKPFNVDNEMFDKIYIDVCNKLMFIKINNILKGTTNEVINEIRIIL